MRTPRLKYPISPIPVVSISGNTSLSFDLFYTSNNSSPSTQTLPSATGSNGIVTVENTGTGSLTVAAQSTQTINGASSQILGQYASITVRDYASGKWIIMY